jgi:hypothetical protein
MDLIIYCIILVLIGFMRVGQTAQVSDDVGIVDTGVTTVTCAEYADLPVGQNLGLIKEPDAYTLILEEWGLK